MLSSLVRYLHDSYVPFRIVSASSPEHLPKVAIPTMNKPVQTKVMLIDGRPALVCYGAEEQLDSPALIAELGTTLVVAGGVADLREEHRRASSPLPPFGGLFGIPVIVDEGVTRCALLCFHAFDDATFGEVPYDDFARLEQPRIAKFAYRGELEQHTSPP
ncbi:MAG: hypothetical protein KF819_14935 [Labilithrix sp.]|nr:hypothetical protein [Labilithrix sp.]